jgi:hypothetical protein
LEDGPAEWGPFDVDEGDETSVERIERRVHGAVCLGRDDIVVRTKHPRLPHATGGSTHAPASGPSV